MALQPAGGGGFWGGIGRAAAGMLGGAGGGFLANLMTPIGNMVGNPNANAANQNQGPGQIVPEPPPMRVPMYNRMAHSIENPNIAPATAAMNNHMANAGRMAAQTNAAVADTMRHNANRVTHNRANQMRLAGQQAMANAEASRSQAIVEQARQDAMARAHEANAKTERLKHAMRML